ncbi:MAG: VOC family protein [Halolamina sp.]
MPRVDNLGHVHLKVSDLDRVAAFYTAALGVEVAERHANFAFCTLGKRHHDLALQAVPGDGSAPPTERPAVGLYHAAWLVDDEATLAAVYDRLRDRGVAVSPVDHGISKVLYFDDPDGNGVGVYLDTRTEDDREAWRGQDERFDPETLGE